MLLVSGSNLTFEKRMSQMIRTSDSRHSSIFLLMIDTMARLLQLGCLTHMTDQRPHTLLNNLSSLREE